MSSSSATNEMICVVEGCKNERAENKRRSGLMKKCEQHAAEHREKCRQSYKRRISREQAIHQQKVSIADMNEALTNERLTNRRLRNRLESIQKEHDKFVATVTSNSKPGTIQGDLTIMSLLSAMNGTISQLVDGLTAEESNRAQFARLQDSYDALLTEHKEALQKLGQLQGKLLTQKQIVDLITRR